MTPWRTVDESPPSPLGVALRRLAAVLLHGASRGLGTVALRLVAPRPPAPTRELQLEFHAEAGAPEGALYVDGELVGRLPGVQRL